MIRKILNIAVNILYSILKQNNNKIVFTSFPDFSGNSFTMFIYILNNHDIYENIWLVSRTEKEVFRKIVKNYSTNYNYKVYTKNSIIGFYHFLTSRFVFHTHGVYNKLGIIKNHKIVNLWHGMPIKKIGLLESIHSGNIIYSNFHLSTSATYQKIISKAFGVTQNKVLNLGQPSNDLLLSNKFNIHKIFNNNNNYKSILWMPTYRKSVLGDIRVDGEKNSVLDFFNESSLNEFNTFFKEVDAICYIKLHPMDYMNVDDFNKYSNIIFLDNHKLNKKGINLYSILNSVDILLTDFSSIYIDFLLLDKPIGFVFSDFIEYNNSRGFIFENPKDFMPGKIISSKNQLVTFLTEVIVEKNDEYKEKRDNVRTLFHTDNSNFSERLFNTLLEQ